MSNRSFYQIHLLQVHALFIIRMALLDETASPWKGFSNWPPWFICAATLPHVVRLAVTGRLLFWQSLPGREWLLTLSILHRLFIFPVSSEPNWKSAFRNTRQWKHRARTCILEATLCHMHYIHAFLHPALQKEGSNYAKMLIKFRITSSDLLLFWNIKRVGTGTPFQKTRKKTDTFLTHFINLNTVMSYQMVWPPPANTGRKCQNMFFVTLSLHLGHP